MTASLADRFVAQLTPAAVEVHAFKIGTTKPRSRGDKDEPFGGRGASWKGALVGGELLVHAVTQGLPAEHLFGNFPDCQHYPTL
jgi:hypothetical protein